MIEWKCPNCWTTYEVDEKFSDALKNKENCKFCVRKDPNVPTTAEMDGLFTQEDMRERNSVMFQCNKCNKWTKHTDYLLTRKHVPCSNCGETSYDSSSIKSVRTYNPDTDNKRRIAAKKKR